MTFTLRNIFLLSSFVSTIKFSKYFSLYVLLNLNKFIYLKDLKVSKFWVSFGSKSATVKFLIVLFSLSEVKNVSIIDLSVER